MTFKSIISVIICLAILTSCSSQLARREEYIASYQCGSFQQSDAILCKAIDNSLPQENYRKSKDAVWLLLDRATERFATGRIEEAISDYDLALQAIDYYNQDDSPEKVGQFLLEDGIAAYPGEDFEQILARVYFALALLHQGDMGNAQALLRQAEDVQQRKQENYRNHRLTREFNLVDNPVAKYLLACLAEKNGDFSNAEILYQQTANLLGRGGLCPELHPNHPHSDSCTLLIVGHNGNAPLKVSEFSDASVASAFALEMILCSNHIDPAISSMTGIPVPALVQSRASFPVPLAATVNSCQKALFPLCNVTAVAAQQLKERMPIIVARGVARMLSRRTAVAFASEQNSDLGAVVDLAMLIANASTAADIRTWGTLPSSIDLARFDLPPGRHTLTLRINNQFIPPFVAYYDLHLKPEDLCVINIFNIHPGVHTVHIPKRFLISRGEST